MKIVHVNDTDRVSTLSDSTRPVRSASWDPTGKYLVTASCDGKLRIYDTEGTTPLLLKIMEGVISSSESECVDTDTIRVGADFQLTHIMLRCLAPFRRILCHSNADEWYVTVSSQTNQVEIGIINRDGWTKAHTFTSDGPKAVRL